MKESDMYLPVKELFEGLGYKVNSEVNSMDITAVKDEELVIIEMKIMYNVKLLIQAAKGQRLSSEVYVAIPRPKHQKKNLKSIKDKEYLLRRLEIGLIYVAMDIQKPYAQIVFTPKPFDRKKSISRSKSKKRIVMKEISERHGDYNIGGSTGRKLVTAYREKALLIAGLLKKHSEMTVKEIRELGAGEKALSILNSNYYRWFERVSRGKYKLSETGVKEIEEYSEIINMLIEGIENK
ncbi:DUF2161 family putative PD-(D/E)XK-type phosphodiesterase [Clostridium sp. DL1XJH146]